MSFDCFLKRKNINYYKKYCEICACPVNIITVGREGCAQIDHIYLDLKGSIWLENFLVRKEVMNHDNLSLSLSLSLSNFEQDKFGGAPNKTVKYLCPYSEKNVKWHYWLILV